MIDIKKTFIELTKKTYPYGTEKELTRLLKQFNLCEDEFGNYFKVITKKDGKHSDTMFCSHLDTYMTTSKRRKIIHVYDGDFIKTDGTTNLGADDKAGVVLMLYMISVNLPGLYYFFIGEEEGCIGSWELSQIFSSKIIMGDIPQIKKCIAFDRSGYQSVITHQREERCASHLFASELAEQLNNLGFNYHTDSTGISCDSAEFISLIQECTNISVGYFNEHSINEYQDIRFLSILAEALIQIDWNSLPVNRKL